jgi:hypothetical protein
MRGHEAHRHSREVFGSHSQLQQQGDLCHQPAGPDPENSSGTNYAVEVWYVKPHEVAPMSEVALTIIGVVNETVGVPALCRCFRLKAQLCLTVLRH